MAVSRPIVTLTTDFGVGSRYVGAMKGAMLSVHAPDALRAAPPPVIVYVSCDPATLARDLKRDDPTREVVWVAEPAPAEVVRHHPDVDRVVVFRKRAGWSGVRELWGSFSEGGCDLTVNFMRYAKGALATLATRAPIRLGLPPSKTRDGVHLIHNHRLTEGPWQHTQDLFLRFREPLGLPSDAPVTWGLCFSDLERAARDRTFQALRIATNDEIGSLEALLGAVERWGGRTDEAGCWLNPGARVAAISFHSLEDRPVKRAFAEIVGAGHARAVTRKPVVPTDDEQRRNPRSRSAKLRVIRLGGGNAGGDD